jgi:uncharacterized radical SAM superfamily protein
MIVIQSNTCWGETYLEDLKDIIDKLRNQPLEILLEEAWEIRLRNFPSNLHISVPSAKTYITDHYRNKRDRFVNISLTGERCALNCEHCKRKLLASMVPAENPKKLKEVGDALLKKGCKGVLISGGASKNGMVPLDGFFDSIQYLKEKGLQVIVHTGLVDQNTARKLKEADVDQVLLDIMGDQETIKKVYHMDRSPEDFADSLRYLREADIEIAPHIVIGINFGRISGEYNALRMIAEVDPEVIVLVALSPMYETPMYGVVPPSSQDITRISSIARIVNPKTKLTFGCARPPGPDKIYLEKNLIRSGINSIAYPSDDAIDYAESLGLRPEFKEECCSLL